MKRILILGGTGMLGHTLFAYLAAQEKWDVHTTARDYRGLAPCFPEELAAKVRPQVDADNFDTVIRGLAAVQPDIVINCIGLIKQTPLANDPLSAITVNSQLPHRLSMLCRTAGARLIHISTDCVFDGKKGNYREVEAANASDLYGRTKLLGEVAYPHCVTLRTSIIGHELKGYRGLVEWFMAQKGSVCGFKRALFSGFPTIEFARIISEYVLPNEDLSGVYHVSSEPISKYDLLTLIATSYDKEINIEPEAEFIIDRSLDSSLFQKSTGYRPPSWPELVEKMYQNFTAVPYYKKRKLC